MKTMNATDAKNRFGELLDSAQAGPVAIQKNGRDVAVVLSKEEYEQSTRKGPNPLALHFHEEIMDQFDASFRKLAE
ncbi:MAG: type II toxin-antitoxin system Phd/YefM family antitoxin [Ahrensia sp.]|nr:type II toxin-antitoxin system Phd/YefM family antitoxin [Ahrensia sp.]